MSEIKFNVPLITGNEVQLLEQLIANGSKFSGDGVYTRAAADQIGQIQSAPYTLLTTSCTHGLELAALILNIKPGDEVIMPSFTFVSTANAFALRGAKIVFVDIRPDTMNIDEQKLEEAITDKTVGVVPVHYAGVGCEMNSITELCKNKGLWIVEDAAQCIGAKYEDKALGTIGEMGTLSFHDTKNIHCGEGGALILRDREHFVEAEVLREKGTNRKRFLRGEIDKYTWVDIGSSYLLSDLNAAFLSAQLSMVETVTSRRRAIWNRYKANLEDLENSDCLELPHVPEECEHNGHLFYVKTSDINKRQGLINYLKEKGINAVFHYIPLHTTNIGRAVGRFSGADHYTTRESERLLRLPLHFGLTDEEVDKVCETIAEFYRK